MAIDCLVHLPGPDLVHEVHHALLLVSRLRQQCLLKITNSISKRLTFGSLHAQLVKWLMVFCGICYFICVMVITTGCHP